MQVLDKAFRSCREANPWVCQRHLHPRLRLLPQDLRPGWRVPGVCVQEHEPDSECDAFLQLRRRHLAHSIGKALQTIGDWEPVRQKGQDSQSPLHTGMICFFVRAYMLCLPVLINLIWFTDDHLPGWGWPKPREGDLDHCVHDVQVSSLQCSDLLPWHHDYSSSDASQFFIRYTTIFHQVHHNDSLGASHAVGSWRLVVPLCFFAFPLPPPSTHRQFKFSTVKLSCQRHSPIFLQLELNMTYYVCLARVM